MTLTSCQDHDGVKHLKLMMVVVVAFSSHARISWKFTVKGGTRRGRQKKRWEDNIKEWTGLEFARSQRAAENKEKWRKMDVKSSVIRH